MIWRNRVFLAAVIAWAAAQTIKVVLDLIKNRKFSAERLVGAGGMPSSHTAFVIALVTAVARYAGVESVAFAVSAAFALVTMYDATGIRRAAGEQAKILNYMMDNWKQPPEMFQKDLKELLGHTPVEVLVGGVLGFVIGLLV